MNNTYKPFGSYLFRTPLFPFESMEKFCRDTEAVKQFTQQAAVMEALYLASPELYSEIQKWLNGEIKEQKENDRILYSLMRYLLRMTTRPTPFGLFAGCSISEINKKKNSTSISNTIELKEASAYHRHTRLDMNYLCALAQDLCKLTFIREHLLFFPNSSIYRYGEQLRYVEYRYQNKRRFHHLVAVDDSEYLQKILHKAANGAKMMRLAEEITEADITSEEAKEFVEELVQSQILVSNLDPAITGNEFLEQIIEVLSGIPIQENGQEELSLSKIISILEQTKRDLNYIDNSSLGVDVNLYKKIADNLRPLRTEFEEKLLFQSDMYKPVAESNIELPLVYDVLKGSEVLNRLTAMPSKTNLSNFKEAFYERYEDKEVPLQEALDTETGIGYLQGSAGMGDISPLVDGISPGNNGNGTSEISWNKKDSFLFDKYIKAISENKYEIEITDKEVEDFPTDKSDLPNTLSTMVSIVENNSSVFGHPLISIHSVGGSSAANLLGRFCFGEEEVFKLTKEITDKEQEMNADVIYAEIVHLPESRIGNILLRPVLRDYEIPYLAKSAVENEYQISLNDLMLSVRNNRLVLRSKRLNKEIQPRLASAHNFSNNALPIYHFLCELQNQNSRGGVGLYWFATSGQLTFLPRVVYKNIILEPATWNLKKEDYEALMKTNDAELIEKVTIWRNKYKIPRYVALSDGDNELVIDFENLLCTKTLFETVKKRSGMKLVEFLFNPEQAAVKSKEGRFVNQFIIPFYRIVPKAHDKVIFEENKSEELKRSYVTGDEWLYLKFYTGHKTADLLLTQLIKPVTAKLLQEGLIDKWVFIRYTDPKHHIRIRFHSKDKLFYQKVIEQINEFAKPFIENKLIWKVQTDTYNREIERYGNETIELAETLFFYDSISIVDMIDMIEGDEGEEIRWLFALRAVDQFLDDFSLSIEQKHQLMDGLAIGFGKEFNVKSGLKTLMGSKFQDYKEKMELVLNRGKDADSEIKPLFEVLEEKTRNTNEIISQVIAITNEDQTKLFNHYLPSYIHMQLNRIFKSKQRLHEMVIYTMLAMYYKGEIGKRKFAKQLAINN